MYTKKPIGVIDSGIGNIQSVINALNYLKIPISYLKQEVFQELMIQNY